MGMIAATLFEEAAAQHRLADAHRDSWEERLQRNVDRLDKVAAPIDELMKRLSGVASRASARPRGLG